MLKKLMTATGIVATGITGAMLFGGPANADVPYAKHRAVPVTKHCYNTGQGAYHLNWCRHYHPRRHHGWHQGRHYGWYRPYHRHHRHGAQPHHRYGHHNHR